MESFKRPETFEGTCPVCKMLYVKEEPGDRRIRISSTGGPMA